MYLTTTAVEFMNTVVLSCSEDTAEFFDASHRHETYSHIKKMLMNDHRGIITS